MTDFYAYFELTGTVPDRVGAVSAEHARRRMPDGMRLLHNLCADGPRSLVARDVEVEPINLMPSWQAEEFAFHGFMDLPERPRRRGDDDETPSGIQLLYTVDVRVFARTGFIISAPTSALAEQRAEAALDRVRELGFGAITVPSVRFARVEILDVRLWQPERPALVGSAA